MHMKSIAVALVLLPLFAAPAAAQLSESTVENLAAYRGGPGRPRRGCQPLREPRVLPAVSALADSAALSGAVAAFARDFPVTGDTIPYGLYSVTVGPGGRVQSMHTVHYWLPASQAEAFALHVRAHLRPAQLPESTVRLRVRLGETPRLTVENAYRCPAELRGDFRIRTENAGAARPQPTMRVRARVAADGSIISVHILRSSGDAEIDRWVQGTLQRSRAVPGLIDGEPAEMDVEEEIRVRIN